jgi:transcriptional regulator with XRE-family HTH domain
MQVREGSQRGDLARRIRHCRMNLGLSVEELATSAGINPVYLSYFEDHADGNLSPGTLRMIARALQTSPDALLGGVIDRPPGGRRATGKATLEALSRQQCLAHLAAGGIGRLVFLAPRGPVALPVNYAFSNERIVLATDLFKAMSLEIQERVSLEVDRVGEDFCEGWSVVASGPARRASDEGTVSRIASLGLIPWAGGNRDALVEITVSEISGRVVVRSPA